MRGIKKVSIMSKPSLTDFLAAAVPTLETEKAKPDLMMVSYRVKPERWVRLSAYRTAERMPLQAVIDAALTEYFDKRGLPF